MFRNAYLLDRAADLRAASEKMDDPLARVVLAALIDALEEGTIEDLQRSERTPCRP
jgi:hypothetical protein